VARMLSLFIALLICQLSVIPASAASPRDDLHAHIDALLRIAEDRSLSAEQRADRARTVVSSMFDFASAAPRALGAHWERLSASQRQALTRMLSGFLTEAVVARIGYAPRRFADRLRERIAFGGESLDGDRATVRVTLLRRHESLPVVADMVRRDTSWRVADLWLDGVSVVDNYRAQLDRLIRGESYDDMVERLHTKWETLIEFADTPGETPNR
jgi:phospholipid transport system substrate-binding protein